MKRSNGVAYGRSADRHCVAISARSNILRFDMIIGSAWVILLAD